MNKLPVPCARPWAATAIMNQRGTVSIIVGTGSKTRYFNLHVDALRQQSAFFRDALIPLPNAWIGLFTIFATWLYRGTLDAQDESKLSYLFLAQHCEFATGLHIPQMRNRVIDVSVQKMEKDASELPYDIMAYIEETLRDSALRDMLVDIMRECGDKDKLAGWKVNLAKGLWMKGGLRGQDGYVIPFGRASDVKGYLVEVRAKVCERYHEHHTEGDGMIRERKEEWFFDPPLS